jgi:hypothetical protein
MKVKFKYHMLLLSVILLAFTSCEKVVQLKLDNAEPQLVIEGAVTNQTANHSIKISYSVPFSERNTFPPVRGAVVTITDDHNGVYLLTETSTLGTYATPRFTGRVGYTYTLNVQVNGKTYTGSSTMPVAVKFEDLSFKDSFFDKNKKLITIHFRDPIGVANQYRFVMFVNNIQVKSIFDEDDSFTNGRYVDEDLYQDDIDIKMGDVVIVEGQCIDYNIYTYWFSLSQQGGGGRGGGSPTPSNPPSNLSNKALGYFSAHTVQRLGIIIQ